MRFRFRFSPLDSRVESFGLALDAAVAVAGRSAPAQRAGAHGDSFAVAGEHQHVVGIARRGFALGVEGVEVDRGPLGEFLRLAFAQLLTGGPCDGLDRVVEGTSGAFDRGEAAKSVGVAFLGQVQCRIGRVQVGVLRATVGDPADPDVTEHRRQYPGMPMFDATPDGPVGSDHFDSRFPQSPQFQVVAEQLP